MGFFAAVIVGAVLSTFNAVLNSASTIFSVDVYKRLINREATERKMVRMGRLTATLLALLSIVSAPLVANASEGLYQLLQELNGIFFIPIASIMLGGFLFRQPSAAGAKAALFTGLVFYVLCTFVLRIDLHFVHVWGVEFLLNMMVMFGVSRLYPRYADRSPGISETPVVAVARWRFTRPFAVFLVVITLAIYVLLGNV